MLEKEKKIRFALGVLKRYRIFVIPAYSISPSRSVIEELDAASPVDVYNVLCERLKKRRYAKNGWWFGTILERNGDNWIPVESL